MKFLRISGLALCVLATGCAAQNGGGLVVGNPIVSDGTAKNMKKGDTMPCACTASKDARLKKTCKCAAESVDSH
jgi:hypothetical protein